MSRRRRSPVIARGATAALAMTLPFTLEAQARQTARMAPVAALSTFDSTTFTALSWRNVGPWRGGRSVAVAGLPSNPMTYFAGYTGGGLWRTDDAGNSWRNISDGHFTSGSSGAIAVAPSDENVIYVGTGEHAIRGQSSTYGDGMYKSTDQGRTRTRVRATTARPRSAARVRRRHPGGVHVGG